MYWVLSRLYLFIIKGRGKRVLSFYGSKKAHCRQFVMVVQVTHTRVASFPGRGTENHRNPRIPDKRRGHSKLCLWGLEQQEQNPTSSPCNTVTVLLPAPYLFWVSTADEGIKFASLLSPPLDDPCSPRAPEQWNNSLRFFQQKLLLLPAPRLI